MTEEEYIKGINMTRRGKLKIYFGYSSGVGKTYTMLKDAHQELAEASM